MVVRTSPGFRGSIGFGNRRFFHHHRRFFFSNGCFNGFGGTCGAGFWWYPYLAGPIFWPTYGTGADEYAQPAAPSYNDTAMQVQLQRLTDEVDRLRDEQAEHNQAAQPAPEQRPNRMDLPTILVFRDGKRLEVSNYGIAGQTLWIFNEQRARKVPLSELDLGKTSVVNAERGVDFAVPAQRP